MSNHTIPSNSFSCCLIGGDTLLTQCGEQLLTAGHKIVKVVTDSNSVTGWANGHSIPVLAVSSDYATVLQTCDYDYLFAITHLALISDAVVESPKKGAINFHDGPLPSYAGLNTPMWAIINGESTYGISWHVMATGIDTGDLLLTQSIRIAEDDTAVSLNTKCFAAALDSFPTLINQVAENSLSPIAQDLAQRNYYARADRPQNFCVLDWQLPATTLGRLVRALHTDRYENVLGTAKLIANDTVYTVEDCAAYDEMPTTSAGEILAITERGVQVSCGEGVLEIRRLQNLSGVTVAIESLNLAVGDNLTYNLGGAVESVANRIAKDEFYWIKVLSQTHAQSLPYRETSSRVSNSDVVKQRQVSIPDSLQKADAKALAGAFVTFLARVTGSDTVSLAISGNSLSECAIEHPLLLCDYALVNIEVDQAIPVNEEIKNIQTAMLAALSKSPWLRDLVTRQPKLRANPIFANETPQPVAINFDSIGQGLSAELTLCLASPNEPQIRYMSGAYSEKSIDQLLQHFETWLQSIATQPEARYCDLDLLSSKERDRLLVKLNQTEKSYDSTLLAHSDFENLAASAPDSIALVAAGQSITYGELNTRASNVAAHLLQQGVGPDKLVGIYVSRSIELIIATIGVLKSGAAYVPLDPAFPADRIAFMVEDSDMATVIFQSSLRTSIPDTKATLLDIDSISQNIEVDQAQQGTVQSNNLAYVIYTSGSTGKPKGVMLEHRNVVNFFVAMDQAVPGAKQENRTWLAVTSLSFDISVLELLWTLNRGFKVVIYDEASSRSNIQLVNDQPSRVLDMSLFMWGNDDAPGPEKYRLLLEGSKYFDANGFSAVWTPERHFHAFGGPYPNPAVTGAAVAAITKNITIRAGSCVVPLHHPVRIAEEWAVVDNLSNGRVEVAAASGWNPTDFILRPENHTNNKQVMYDQLEQVRQLWRGEKLTFPGPLGDVEVESLPRPVQKELPCWITTAGNPETWKDAGRLGLHVLTHLLGQTIEEVADKIQMYRDARSEAGFDPATGQVALMLHTFIGDDTDEVRDLVREPMKDYLSSSMKLAMDYAWSFPAFKRPGGEESKPEDVDLRSLSDEDVDTILNFAFERYFEDSGLFGDNTRCMNMLAKADGAGVNEIACLMDFGVETQLIMDSLPKLSMLRQQMVEVVNAKPLEMNGNSFSDLINAHSISHLQCTPSTARMYLTDADSRSAFGKIDHILLGGEALPPTLAAEVKAVNPGTLSNMYGPTETTIWSLTSRIENLDHGISIGTPIANTQVYVLDKFHKPLPTGIPGELFIAGDGVARGYLNRPELTSEKFLDNPFTSDVGKRMYATGDLAVFREDGLLDYQGRTDFQVKVRGYRIELGEIESRLEADQKISEAAVVVRQENDGDQRLVAYVTSRADATLDTGEMRNMLRGTLPEYMVPNEFVTIQYMPRTANGKLDRKALLEIKQAVTRNLAADTAPSSDVEKLIGNLWCKVLKLDAVGLSENFFDLGGHSLLVVQLHGQLKEAIEQPISLTDLYEHTTIKALAEYLTSGTDSRSVKQSVSRGEQRRALRRRRAS